MIKITNLFQNTIDKILYNIPSIRMERKIDSYQKIVNRNKLIAPATTSIDDVVAVAKQKKIQYHVYF